MSGRKRKKCDHCNEMLMEAMYIDLYYNKDLNKWNKTTDVTDLATSSSESEQKFESYSDPGNLTDGI